MYQFTSGQLPATGCVVVAKSAADFSARFGQPPDFELADLDKLGGSWSLANTGDELLLLGPNNEPLDAVAFRNGDYTALGLEEGATAPEPHSLQRVWATDTNSMPHDFVRTDPTPGQPTIPPAPPATAPPAAALPGGMFAYWGHIHAHTTYSDGAGPPYYALAMARAAGLHFYGISDHGWWLTESEWTRTLSQTQAATAPGQFIAVRGVEWSHDTAGHLNIYNSGTLLHRQHPLFGTLSDLYTWLAANPNVVAQFNHPDPGYGGTFFDFALHPAAAQQVYAQEIGNNAQEYTTYEPQFVQSNLAGWRTAPTINGDTHTALWGRDLPGRTGIIAPELTEAALLDALRARRVFATEDSNLALALRAGEQWMGSTLAATGPLTLTVHVSDFDGEAVTLQLFDGNLPLETVSFSEPAAVWPVQVDALPGHFYWIKAVQPDGDRAYSAPLWIEGSAPPEPLVINEMLPAPYDFDWNGDGVADYRDEWVEIHNPLNRPVGLGGWRLADSSGRAFDFPLGMSIAAGGFVVVHRQQTDLSLDNEGDSLTLTHPNGAVIDTASYSHSPGYDQSWCRLPDGTSTWNDDCGPSPGEPNWEIPPAGPLQVSIYQAKRLTPGAWVRVKGTVTAPPGALGSRTMYIQDDTAGIQVYLPGDHQLYYNEGDVVRVEGDLKLFHEEFEIVVDERSDVDFVAAGSPRPPLPIATTSLLEPYEGMLVQLTGPAVRFSGSTTFWLDDGTGQAKVYIRRSTGIKKPYIDGGVPVTVIGIAGQYSDKNSPGRQDYRLMPRFQRDLQINEPTALPPVGVPPGWPRLLPDTGFGSLR